MQTHNTETLNLVHFYEHYYLNYIIILCVRANGAQKACFV